MAQWESGSLITFKMFPRYYPRLPHTGENIRLHLQAHSDLLPLLFTLYQNYARCLTQYHVELANLSIAKPHTFSDLKIFGF